MAIQRTIRQGEIYWIDNFPPLDGHEAKRRPVVVIGHIIPGDLKSPVLAAGVSHTSSTMEKDPDRIKLPDTQQTPEAKTGMAKACWVLPRWALLVESHRFDIPVGHVKGALLKRIVMVVANRAPK